MGLEHYIAELLYRYNCVVVPNFGAFLTNTTPAHIDNEGQTFYPPMKVLSFNQQLTKNDGLLVSHIAHSKHLSYEELLKEIIETAEHWQEKIERGNQLVLKGIGALWMGKEQKIQFRPEKGLNYLASSFGLSSFNASPILREKLKEEVKQLEEKVPFAITPERRAATVNRSLLKNAAVSLLLLATGASSYQFYQ